MHRDAEIDQNDLARVVERSEQVRGLDVTVHYAMSMYMVQSGKLV